MIFKIIEPAPHLRTFIKDYSLLHFEFDKNARRPVKPFPANTQHCLVFYLRGIVSAVNPKSGLSKTYPEIAINGCQISRFDFHLSPDYLMFSVNFQPGALSKFLRLPLTEFVDERIDAEAILNPEISRLRERMSNSDSFTEMIQMIENYLWARIQNLKIDFDALSNVTRLISENPVGLTVEKMADLACLSISQFERRFLARTGITPRFFARINRFHQAYQIKDQNPKMDWLTVAVQTGYYDYQHLVKDFRQFSGTSPHSLLEAQSKSPERILGIG